MTLEDSDSTAGMSDSMSVQCFCWDPPVCVFQHQDQTISTRTPSHLPVFTAFIYWETPEESEPCSVCDNVVVSVELSPHRCNSHYINFLLRPAAAVIGRRMEMILTISDSSQQVKSFRETGENELSAAGIQIEYALFPCLCSDIFRIYVDERHLLKKSSRKYNISWKYDLYLLLIFFSSSIVCQLSVVFEFYKFIKNYHNGLVITWKLMIRKYTVY